MPATRERLVDLAVAINQKDSDAVGARCVFMCLNVAVALVGGHTKHVV